MMPQERARFSAARPYIPKPIEAFLMGRYYSFRRTPDGLRTKVSTSCSGPWRRTRLTPLPMPGSPDDYVSLGWDLFAAVPPAGAFPKAKQAARKALELDPNCAEAHAALGWDGGGRRLGLGHGRNCASTSR